MSRVSVSHLPILPGGPAVAQPCLLASSYNRTKSQLFLGERKLGLGLG